MIDQYQIQLTRMLESEQYGEAKKLLRFLLKCQGDEKRHYEEWASLLSWLDMAFPEEMGGGGYGFLAQAEYGSERNAGEDEEDEEALRKVALAAGRQDEEYVQQVLYILRHHPMPDQQMLALERAAHLEHPDVAPAVEEWLLAGELHPALQFKALQTLKRLGRGGTLQLERLGEDVMLDIEATPLSMDDFPPAVRRVVERVESVTEVIDSTLPHFARELWKQCLQCIYGTTAYGRLQSDDEETIDCFAAALHHVLELSLYGRSSDDDIRDTYGITDSLRFRYEQASKALRQVAEFQGTDERGDS